MFFKDVIGQEEVKRRLLRSVDNDHVAHAQLLCGPEGVGKFAMAMAYARYIHCTNRQNGDACGVCPSCRQHTALTHPDLHFVFPMVKVDKKKRICDDYLPEWTEFLKENTYFGIDSWLRYINADNKQAVIYGEESESILRKMSLKSYESPYKIMIIWLPERMNDTCSNKLLKLLEEPYPGSVFLLVSNNPDRVLGTIRSRSQLIEIRSLSTSVIAEALQRRYGITEQDAISVAHVAEGNYLKACEALQLNEENKLFFDYFVQVMRLAYARKIKDLKIWSEEVADLGRERLRRFLSYTQRMIRENYIYNLHVPALTYMNLEEATSLDQKANPVGVYEISNPYGEVGTALPGYQDGDNFEGCTYIEYTSYPAQGLFLVSGTITITSTGEDVYKVEIDAKDGDGRRVQAVYEGDMYITDKTLGFGDGDEEEEY